MMRTLLRKITWAWVPIIGTCAFSVYQGVPKCSARDVENCSAKIRDSGERNSGLTNKSKNKWGRSLFNSPIGDNADIIDECSESNSYCPPEWNALSAEAKAKLANLLTWDNLSKWDFNIFEVAELTIDPLLLVGWALLCGPMAQDAMQTSLEVKGDADVNSNGCVSGENTNTFRYQFHEHFEINPQTICNFLREIERRYNRDIPFHNSVHAADVTQTTHCLLQLMGEDYLTSIFDSITIFSLLLAAAFHDVCHPGTNNLFQQNAQTSIAVKYENTSILENMHLAVGLSLLFGEGIQDEWDIFDGWINDDKVRVQEIMKESILKTDISHQSELLGDLELLIEQVHTVAKENNRYNAEIDEPILSILAQTFHEAKSVEGEDLTKTELEGKCNQLAGLLVGFILHGADISNPAKSGDLPIHWGSRVFDEFFEQGDKEKEMGLPISPLCDRGTVKLPESQVNFIKYVALPTYELLGSVIPRVKKEVVPNMSRTIEYWEGEKN